MQNQEAMYDGARALSDRSRRGLPSPHALCPAGTAPPPPRQGVGEQRLRRMGSPRRRRPAARDLNVPAIFLGFLALLGFFVGVFVEGVVSSYHHDGTFWPWPCCRRCGARASLGVLVPVLGYLRQARCRACGCEQRTRGLQVEAATALAFVALGAQYWGHPRADWPLLLVVSLAEAALLVVVLFIDLELRLIPTLLVAVLVALALAGATLVPATAWWPGLGLGSALLGGAVGFAAFGALVVLAHVVFGEGALGMGDANLALAIGCITGYPLVIFALSTGIFLGGIGAVATLVAKRGGLRSTMPYGPYLVLAVLFVLAHGNTINPLGHF